MWENCFQDLVSRLISDQLGAGVVKRGGNGCFVRVKGALTVRCARRFSGVIAWTRVKIVCDAADDTIKVTAVSDLLVVRKQDGKAGWM